MDYRNSDNYIDLGFLEKVSGGDSSIIKSFVQDYVEEKAKFEELVRFSISHEDKKRLKETVHSFKSTVKVMGMIQVMQELEPFEKEIDSKPWDEIKHWYSRINGLLTQSGNALRQSLHLRNVDTEDLNLS